MICNLYSLFHLNLAYSSIEEAQHGEVIERCYRPLLELAERHGLPVGVEVTGHTLQRIADLDPQWIERFKRLLEDGRAELIGSGHAQIIGPLVPADLNRANLRLGMQDYERILDITPTIAFVNEQAYSAGLVPLYREAGYRALVMEWDNPYQAHPEWDPAWRAFPQYALGPDGDPIALIWNESIPFQQVQRYAHGELELDELVQFIERRRTAGAAAFPLYGNDAEIFDYRPGRYQTEARLHEDGEWRRLQTLAARLAADPGFRLILPGRVLDLMDRPGAGHELRLESAAQPVPVKKQRKYNILRWALTGRDDLGINTACRRRLEQLRADPDADDHDWSGLCELWASDYRTHITQTRWDELQARLPAAPPPALATAGEQPPPNSVTVERRGRFLQLRTDALDVTLNLRRGLSLHQAGRRNDAPLCGTLAHGHFDNIAWGSDWYSGHLVFESPGHHKLTDLAQVEPTISGDRDWLYLDCLVPTSLGDIRKRLGIGLRRPIVRFDYHLRWPEIPVGSLRVGNFTLLPGGFDRKDLFYRTHNGGDRWESFAIRENIDHGQPVSSLISAHCALGMTEGVVELGDRRRCLRIEVDQSTADLLGMLTHAPVADSWFCRLSLSAGECDETSRPRQSSDGLRLNFQLEFIQPLA